MGLWLILRQVIVRLLASLPFVLAFLIVPQPFNSLALCLFMLRKKSAADTEAFEVATLTKFIARRISLDDDGRNELKKIHIAFMDSEHTIDPRDVQHGAKKVAGDLLMDLLDLVVAALMLINVGIYALRQYT
ncbi:hypothetical protein [Pararhizobium sp. DWP3-4]|uniref:hypothetical protein n=1 Tax=Pararhizobium sp. DWP3-4 TaxID=2804565 RepID=UPI003CEC4ECD